MDDVFVQTFRCRKDLAIDCHNASIVRGNPFNGHDVEQRSIRGGQGVFLQEHRKHDDRFREEDCWHGSGSEE